MTIKFTWKNQETRIWRYQPPRTNSNVTYSVKPSQPLLFWNRVPSSPPLGSHSPPALHYHMYHRDCNAIKCPQVCSTPPPNPHGPHDSITAPGQKNHQCSAPWLVDGSYTINISRSSEAIRLLIYSTDDFCSCIFKWNWLVISFFGSVGHGQASPIPCTHKGAVVCWAGLLSKEILENSS